MTEDTIMSEVAISKKKHISLFVVAIVITIIFCITSLYIAGLFPQTRVQKGLQESVQIFEREGKNPRFFNDKIRSSIFDNSSEAVILTSSFYMDTRTDPSTIFTKPFNYGRISSMRDVAFNNLGPDRYYERYWEGFRSIIRPLLSFFDYGEIRLIIYFIVNILFVLAASLIFERFGASILLAFALSIIVLNLIVISNSFQHSICFVISFFAIIVMLRSKKVLNRFSLMFFCVTGMLTQFYDFYTVPLITFAYPMSIMLLFLREESKKQTKPLLYGAVSWVSGYAGMWLTNLTLTSMFTPINALEKGFNSFFYRTGIANRSEHSYSVFEALKSVISTLFLTKRIRMIFVFIIAIALLASIISIIKQRKFKTWWNRNFGFLVLASMPLLWYIIAAQPTIIHSFFQFRALGVTVFCFLIVCIDAIRGSENVMGKG